MKVINEQRDLMENGDGQHPAHIAVREFRYEGSPLAASLWLGNENAGEEASALLTAADLDWLITALQRVRGV